MRYLICCILLLCASVILMAQSPSLTPEVVASAGDSYATQNLSLDWTLGELATETFEGTIVLTQGFHQPALQTTSIVDPASQLGAIKVYPNPSTGSIFIEREKRENLQLVLWDIQGRVLLKTDVSTTLSSLDLSHLPAGIYVLQMSNERQATKSIRIQKQ